MYLNLESLPNLQHSVFQYVQVAEVVLDLLYWLYSQLSLDFLN